MLVFEERRAIVVRVGDQRWLRLSPKSTGDALELGYQTGNLHWRVCFDGADLLVSLDGPVAHHAARIEPLIKGGRVLMSEEAE